MRYFSLITLLLCQTLTGAELSVPGELILSLNDPAAAATLREDYALPGETRADGKLLLRVEPGREAVWQAVLAKHPAVRKVQRRTYDAPAAKPYLERSVQPLNRSIKTALAAAPLLERTLQFFGAEPGELHVLQKAPLRLRLELTGMRGQILTSRNYWEKLTIMVILLPLDQQLDLLMFADGHYATGLGNREPAASAYQPIEAEVLKNYLDRLITRLQTALEAP